jgi:hypothetical protein
MTLRRFLRCLQFSAVTLVLCAAFCPTLHAQELLASTTVPDAPSPAPAPPVEFVSPVAATPAKVTGEHRFWDKQNYALLMTAAALNGADFAVTRANLQSGGQELNPVVRMFGRSTPGLAMNFIGETAGVVGLSYFFHKTGHHKLERAVSVVNIGSSATAVGYGLAHR